MALATDGLAHLDPVFIELIEVGTTTIVVLTLSI